MHPSLSVVLSVDQQQLGGDDGGGQRPEQHGGGRAGGARRAAPRHVPGDAVRQRDRDQPRHQRRVRESPPSSSRYNTDHTEQSVWEQLTPVKADYGPTFTQRNDHADTFRRRICEPLWFRVGF